MGTNFYFFTQNKELCEKYFPASYTLTDFPEFGYRIHLAKTSCGWLPLFQAHRECASVARIEEIYRKTGMQIVDESGEFYDWPAFKERVLEFNGGIDGVIPKTPIKVDKESRFYDPDMPEYVPVSHLGIRNRFFDLHYFKDPQGYEFIEDSFT